MKKFLAGITVGILVSVSGLVLASSTVQNFSDVPSNAYYYNAVQTLHHLGVISGYGDGKFGPNDPLTRGQLAAILATYNGNLMNGDSYVRDVMDLFCSKFTADDFKSNSDLAGRYVLLCDERVTNHD